MTKLEKAVTDYHKAKLPVETITNGPTISINEHGNIEITDEATLLTISPYAAGRVASFIDKWTKEVEK